VRALERGRKNKAKSLLDASRSQTIDEAKQLESASSTDANAESRHEAEKEVEHGKDPQKDSFNDDVESHEHEHGITYRFADFAKSKRRKKAESTPPDRKTISEVLHDIYDENVQ